MERTPPAKVFPPSCGSLFGSSFPNLGLSSSVFLGSNFMSSCRFAVGASSFSRCTRRLIKECELYDSIGITNIPMMTQDVRKLVHGVRSKSIKVKDVPKCVV